MDASNVGSLVVVSKSKHDGVVHYDSCWSPTSSCSLSCSLLAASAFVPTSTPILTPNTWRMGSLTFVVNLHAGDPASTLPTYEHVQVVYDYNKITSSKRHTFIWLGMPCTSTAPVPPSAVLACISRHSNGTKYLVPIEHVFKDSRWTARLLQENKKGGPSLPHLKPIHFDLHDKITTLTKHARSLFTSAGVPTLSFSVSSFRRAVRAALKGRFCLSHAAEEIRAGAQDSRMRRAKADARAFWKIQKALLLQWDGTDSEGKGTFTVPPYVPPALKPATGVAASDMSRSKETDGKVKSDDRKDTCGTTTTKSISKDKDKGKTNSDTKTASTSKKATVTEKHIEKVSVRDARLQARIKKGAVAAVAATRAATTATTSSGSGSKSKSSNKSSTSGSSSSKSHASGKVEGIFTATHTSGTTSSTAIVQVDEPSMDDTSMDDTSKSNATTTSHNADIACNAFLLKAQATAAPPPPPPAMAVVFHSSKSFSITSNGGPSISYEVPLGTTVSLTNPLGWTIALQLPQESDSDDATRHPILALTEDMGSAAPEDIPMKVISKEKEVQQSISGHKRPRSMKS
jgi:hypothetical protein